MRLKQVEFTSPVINPKDPRGMRRTSFSAEGVGLPGEVVGNVDLERDPATGVVSLSARVGQPYTAKTNVPCTWVEWPEETTLVEEPAPKLKAAK